MTRDKEGYEDRRKARQRNQTAGQKRAQLAQELEQSKRLAIGLIGQPEDDEAAARSMGLSLRPAQLRRVRLIADKHFPGIIEGDPDSFADSC